VPLVAYAGLAFVIAAVWVVVWPSDKAAGVDGPMWFALRWGHAAAWGFLGLALLARAFRADRLTRPFGLVAGAAYVAFVVSLIGAG
jgi:hypothetical protein